MSGAETLACATCAVLGERCRRCVLALKGGLACSCGRTKSKGAMSCMACRTKKNPDGWIKDGYRFIYKPGHPNAHDGSIAEHRFVMSETLDRALLPEESVHHINGNRLDNRSENLELWSVSQPSGQRVADKLIWAREIMALYGSETEGP